MPTGYTADVQSGKVTEFPEFAMQCARAFGALISMRDDPSGTPIPDEFTPSPYHEDQIEAARANLSKLMAMTVDEQDVAMRQEHADAVAYWHKSRADREREKSRYEAMLAHVKAWRPPTPDHVEMKKFMVEQLAGSIEFDCRPSTAPCPAIGSRSDWYEAKIKAAKKDIDYHVTAHAEEVERCRKRTEWVKALRASLVAHGKD